MIELLFWATIALGYVGVLLAVGCIIREMGQ